MFDSLDSLYPKEYLDQFSKGEEEIEFTKGGEGSGRKKYSVYRRGGSIGETSNYHHKHGSFIKTHDNKEDAKEYAKRSNKTLTPGEKSYYKIKYHVVEHNENDAPKNPEIKKSDTIDLSQFSKTNIIKSFDHIPSENEVRKSLSDKLEKGMITQEVFDKATEQLDNLLVKAKGEGSKGGKIIGHTKSGKPVYAGNKSDHQDHKEWESQDHKDAEEYHYSESMSHGEAASKHRQGTSSYNNHRALSMHHRDVAEGHSALANKKEKDQHESRLSDSEKQIIADQKKKQIAHHEQAMNYHHTMMRNTESVKVGSSPVSDNPHLVGEYDRHSQMRRQHESEIRKTKERKITWHI